METAKELLKKGFLRPAGVVTGVVLEKHLAQVCHNHNIVIKKKDPQIGIYNDDLKNANVFETNIWRLIQRLGDLRNLCCHNKDREPNHQEVSDLIDGTEKIIKTIY
jgi:hypothetical protein